MSYVTRLQTFADITEPYPRAGLYYVVIDKELWEAWAQSNLPHGPQDLHDPNFRWRRIGKRVRSASKLKRR